MEIVKSAIEDPEGVSHMDTKNSCLRGIGPEPEAK